MAETYSNGRILRRAGGRFRKTTAADMGIGGVCTTCHHLLIQHFDGDPRDQNPDPRRFRYRCFTCEPLTDAEKALQAEIDASKPQPKGIGEFLMAYAERRIQERAAATRNRPNRLQLRAKM